jgi:DNA replication and repair protein RecF
MIVTHLELRDWRSYQNLSLSFERGLTLIEGTNGAGKTNLVEAIHYLSLAHSWRSEDEKALIRDGAASSVIEAVVEEGTLRRKIRIELSSSGKKISVNGKPIRRLSELSRLVNVVLFSPADVDLFRSSPNERRAFLDINLSKQSLDYFSLIGKYNHLLKERNAALKRPNPDKSYISVVTDRLIETSEPLVGYRRLYVDKLNKVLLGLAASLLGESRKAEIVYRPFLNEGPGFTPAAKKLFEKSLESDLLHKTTSVGPHREDFTLKLDGKDIAVYGSQGENRLAAIALKLAPYFLIEDAARKPLAVLDDVFSELDDAHSNRLITVLAKFEQTFVTATHKDIAAASLIEVTDHKAIRRI